MLLKYNSLSGQSIYDVCLMTYGTIDLLFKLMSDNNVPNVDDYPEVGTEFIFDDTLIFDEKVRVSNSINNVDYATASNGLNSQYYSIENEKSPQSVGTNPSLNIQPKVDAGPNKTLALPITDTSFTATITPGLFPITSILWTQTSGPALTLSGANTATLTVSGTFAVGTYSFKIEVTDSNGATPFDTVILNVTEALITIRWGYVLTENFPANLADLVYQFTGQFAANASEYPLEFTSAIFDSQKKVFFDQPASTPRMKAWFNSSFNNGPIPDSVFSLPQTVGSRKVTVSVDDFVSDTVNSVVRFYNPDV